MEKFEFVFNCILYDILVLLKQKAKDKKLARIKAKKAMRAKKKAERDFKNRGKRRGKE